MYIFWTGGRKGIFRSYNIKEWSEIFSYQYYEIEDSNFKLENAQSMREVTCLAKIYLLKVYSILGDKLCRKGNGLDLQLKSPEIINNAYGFFDIKFKIKSFNYKCDFRYVFGWLI